MKTVSKKYAEQKQGENRAKTGLNSKTGIKTGQNAAPLSADDGGAFFLPIFAPWMAIQSKINN
jgi:hypothetical protein